LATSDSKSKVENLSPTAWDLVEGYVKILGPLDEATTTACSSTLPILSTVLPMIDLLKNVLRGFVRGGGKGIMFAGPWIKQRDHDFLKRDMATTCMMF